MRSELDSCSGDPVYAMLHDTSSYSAIEYYEVEKTIAEIERGGFRRVRFLNDVEFFLLVQGYTNCFFFFFHSPFFPFHENSIIIISISIVTYLFILDCPPVS